jgi:hypothetical protein
MLLKHSLLPRFKGINVSGDAWFSLLVGILKHAAHLGLDMNKVFLNAGVILLRLFFLQC